MLSLQQNVFILQDIFLAKHKVLCMSDLVQRIMINKTAETEGFTEKKQPLSLYC